ncbi:hypothetical protein GCM10010236_70780 [Streptomyces eurythermus]|nr:hypothetical protein GCM10010236_70780 [Streptomyces eurythermus]
MDDVPVLFFQSTTDHARGLLAGMYATAGLRDLLRDQDTLRDAHACGFASDDCGSCCHVQRDVPTNTIAASTSRSP